MTPEFREIIVRKTELEEELSKINKYIKAYQDICKHDWENIGHDSHKDHYKCKKCLDRNRC